MLVDLHYTRDEVARLRDEATPGPWRRPSKGSRGEKNTAHVYGPDCVVHSMPLPLNPELHHSHARWRSDADLIAAAPTLAADLLTLHARVAELEDRLEEARDPLEPGLGIQRALEGKRAVGNHPIALDVQRGLDSLRGLVAHHKDRADSQERENAAIREQADRMRAVLLALADGCDSVAADSRSGTWDAVVALDDALVACGAMDDDGRTWSDTARALRTLAGDASR